MLKRSNPTPWLHRWSRPLLGAIASLGFALTTYLSALKLSGNQAVCPIQGCEQVLNSIYAQLFGIPLSVFGAIAYLGMAVLALAPLVYKPTDQKLASQINHWSWLLLLTGGVAMTIFSGYLMYLLAFKIQLSCVYCIASALLSTSLLVITILGKKWQDPGQIWFSGSIIAMITLIITLGLFAQIEKGATLANNPTSNLISAPLGRPQPGIGWEVTTTSGAAEIALAQHLTKIGAQKFVAWWCPHCHEQKALFGKEAIAELTQIECDPNGQNNPQPQVCAANQVPGFPSWQIKGQIYSGVKTLNQLADLSGYSGDRNFRYQLAAK
ncbi:MAG: vitamin K epoxide reductase family protein [Pseudanabaenaceae cyanobacterium bins.68]|nr:vitamin K epoxide reductase family protein [Pseudanabaenaceae cyanobacterium bins.68]